MLIIPPLGKPSAADYQQADTIVRLGRWLPGRFDCLVFLADSPDQQAGHTIPCPGPQPSSRWWSKAWGSPSAGSWTGSSKADYWPVCPSEDWLRVVRDLYGTGDYDRGFTGCKRIPRDGGQRFLLELRKKDITGQPQFQPQLYQRLQGGLLATTPGATGCAQRNRLLADLVISENPVLRLRTHSVMGIGWPAERSRIPVRQPLYTDGKQPSAGRFEHPGYPPGSSATHRSTRWSRPGDLPVYRLSGDAFELLGLRPLIQRLVDLNLEPPSAFRDDRHPAGSAADLGVGGRLTGRTQFVPGPTIFYRARLSHGFPLGRTVLTDHSQRQ